MSESIFRTERILYDDEFWAREDFKASTSLLIKNFRSHDKGIPRAREYSIKSRIYFSIFKGKTIHEIILEDFDYFLWFPRKIENFTYDTSVVNYAEKCLLLLEALFYQKTHKFPKLDYAHKQVMIMKMYENELDSDINPPLRDAYKSRVDVNFYKTILNTPMEKLIRQYLTKFTYSPEYRRKYFEEMKHKSKNSNQKDQC